MFCLQNLWCWSIVFHIGDAIHGRFYFCVFLQPPAGNSWLGSLIGTIIGNLKISISNVHVRYEDSVRLVDVCSSRALRISLVPNYIARSCFKSLSFLWYCFIVGLLSHNLSTTVCHLVIQDIHFLVVLLWRSLLLLQWMSREMKPLMPVVLWIDYERLASSSV